MERFVAESIVKRVEYSLFLRTLFGGRRSGVAVERVATLMRDVYFDAGQVIYRRAEASTHIYFIVSGQIVLDAPGLAPWTFGPRDGVGFLDAMQDASHARTARAATDVQRGDSIEIRVSSGRIGARVIDTDPGEGGS